MKNPHRLTVGIAIHRTKFGIKEDYTRYWE